MRRVLALSLLLAAPAALAHDYPTVARADYVLGCMAANGNTRLALERCACAIDAIAAQLPYERYEAADTALRMLAGNLGERGAAFRDPPQVRAEVEALRRAQAEATLQCFP
ncbi:hypothetical protein [Paracraurococcus ruber]|uniref:Secreted protein n=1 Tax=Paracraurococcus ruber TaxID=77675 RepID=A0ABS1CYP6_9PROT|nr:hypothetical protein [Paracraurococcus ruber]MBK1659545.1 hypothetical protein [Paracraurococcus ruber]TDG33081.1 hypothetical protein E2C05_04835 [Paracraurococcus ruber]